MVKWYSGSRLPVADVVLLMIPATSRVSTVADDWIEELAAAAPPEQILLTNTFAKMAVSLT